MSPPTRMWKRKTSEQAEQTIHGIGIRVVAIFQILWKYCKAHFYSLTRGAIIRASILLPNPFFPLTILFVLRKLLFFFFFLKKKSLLLGFQIRIEETAGSVGLSHTRLRQTFGKGPTHQSRLVISTAAETFFFQFLKKKLETGC